MMIIVAAQLQI